MPDAAPVRPLQPEDIPACERILATLPDWFGIDAANRAYVDGLATLPSFSAEIDGRVAGFMSLRDHGEGSIEIEVMAVEPSRHHRGIGRALVERALSWCAAREARWLHVKTRGPSTPDPGYEKTRAFYRAVGFDPLFESTTLWGLEDAALILVRKVERPGPG